MEYLNLTLELTCVKYPLIAMKSGIWNIYIVEYMANTNLFSIKREKQCPQITNNINTPFRLSNKIFLAPIYLKI